jgi:ketosteroid isomerase-like protein
MHRLAVLLLTVACATARQPPRAESSCTGTVDCGREQLVASDQALRQAIQKRGLAPAFAEVFQDDAKLLIEGKGVISGKEGALAELGPIPSVAWTLARADVSSDAMLGYSFGWMEKGHYAAVWRRQGGEWKLAVFMQKAAEPQATAPPAWFVSFRGDRAPVAVAATESVSAADTAFAALGQKAGTQAAFTTYAAEDAVQLARTMIFGRAAIHQLFDGAPTIQWAPIAGDAAPDLGYTVGAYTAGSGRGNYLTVWRLEPDGSWRYVLDGGVSG